MARLDSYIPFMQADPRFYRPLGSDIAAGDLHETIVSLMAMSDATVTRSGPWTNCRYPERKLPPHGWKIHVSATPLNVHAALKAVCGASIHYRAGFKSICDTKLAYSATSRWWPAPQVGKLITIYAGDAMACRDLLDQLSGSLQAHVGPYILTDRRYRNSPCLFYRYGSFFASPVVLPDGTHDDAIVGPSGERWLDTRRPGLRLPPWITDEIDPHDVVKPDGTGSPTVGGYQVTRVLQAGGLGGIYHAKRLSDGVDVILKEARRRAGYGPDGRDAQDRLQQEEKTLRDLADTGVSPQPIEIFQHWEHLFLAQEQVPGEQLIHFIAKNNPLIRNESTQAAREEYRERLEVVVANIRAAIGVCHERGYAFGDLSMTNILVDSNDLSVRLVDFEAAQPIDSPGPFALNTPGFAPTKFTTSRPGVEVDEYGIAACELAMTIPRNTLVAVSPASMAKSALYASSLLGRDCFEAIDAMNLPHEETDDLRRQDAIERATDFILAHMDFSDRACFVPADPGVYATNPWSVAHGLAGVIRALSTVGCPISDAIIAPFADLAALADAMPRGLFYGTAGVAWTLVDCGRAKLAEELFARTVSDCDWVAQGFDVATGLAGIGLAALALWCRTYSTEHMDTAKRCAGLLIDASTDNGRGLSWRRPETEGELEGPASLGYAYGSAGVALFFLYLARATMEDKYLAIAWRALEHDLSYLVSLPSGFVAFPGYAGSKVYTPYVLRGSAGLGLVALRFFMSTGSPDVLKIVQTLYKESAGGMGVSPGLFSGMAGVANFALDCELMLGSGDQRQRIHRTVDAIMSVASNEPEGIAFPGDSLSRFSCDYATGGAGVILTLGRMNRNEGNPNYFCDQVLGIPDPFAAHARDPVL